MKKTAIITAIASLLMTSACNTVDDWGDGQSEKEHIYYVGFYKTNINTDALSYEVAKNGDSRWRYATAAWQNTTPAFVASVPFQFHSERVRSYNAETKFWIVETGLTAGTDYSVSVEGKTLTPTGGVYSFEWPQTIKGIKQVEIKRLTDNNGSLKIYVIDPANGTPDPNKYETSTLNNKTSEYEVRGFSFDFGKVTVTFKD
jgi:hypothetical protein